MKSKILQPWLLPEAPWQSCLGGWDMALETLLILMAADWITGRMFFLRSLAKAQNPLMGRWKAEPGGRDFAGKG